MIITDNYVAYDTTNHFYYFTEAGAVYYTGYDELIDLWGDRAGQRLKRQGRQLHDKYIQSAYNADELRYRHRDIIEYNVYLNTQGEREAIIEALTAMIEITYDNDWDRTLYDNNPKWPDAVLRPLKDAMIYFTGKINYVVPEDEYLVGY